jgi:uncharacterized protein (TIGR03118 family)
MLFPQYNWGLHMRVLDDHVEAVITDDDVDADWQLKDVRATLFPVADSLELSVLQARLIGVLRDREPTMAELGRLLDLDKSSITGLINRAVHRGVVRRVAVPEDGRSFRVVLTDEGLELAGKLTGKLTRGSLPQPVDDFCREPIPWARSPVYGKRARRRARLHDPTKGSSMQHALGKAWLPGTGNQGGGRRWPFAVAAFVAAAGIAAGAGPAVAATTPAATTAKTTPVNSFAQTNLIANKASFGAKLVDKNLTNAWGLAAGPTTPIWVSDNNSGFASVYSGGVNGSAVNLALTVPVPGGNPTGQVFNPDTSAFNVAGTAAKFIVDSDSTGSRAVGEIAAWNGGSSFVVEDSQMGGAGGKTPAGAVFKGLALATTPKAGPELFAADVHNARVDVFNSNFKLLRTPSEFRDPRIPAGYAPFGIQYLDGRIYVTYGKQNRARTDVVPGAGLGFVDVYNVNGQLIRHLAARGPLNEPWGLAIAPAGFGPFGGDLLVGNLGNGWINAFNATTGKYLGPLDTTSGHPIAISGLWGLQFGNSAFGGSSSLVFSAGPNGYANGLVGVLNPAARTSGGGW